LEYNTVFSRVSSGKGHASDRKPQLAAKVTVLLGGVSGCRIAVAQIQRGDWRAFRTSAVLAKFACASLPVFSISPSIASVKERIAAFPKLHRSGIIGVYRS
jgi:hypothetical protein